MISQLSGIMSRQNAQSAAGQQEVVVKMEMEGSTRDVFETLGAKISYYTKLTGAKA
jgi:hypothetical protein